MKQTLDAIYENGIFKPLKRLKMSDGQYVQLVVEVFPESTIDEMLKLASRVYEDLSDEQINEIEQIALNRSDFFGK